MRLIYLTSAIYVLIAFCTSCEKDQGQFPSDQPVYFGYMYKNYAWGYQHFGWLVDNKGNIHYYKMPEDWRYGNEQGISEEDLNHNLSQADSIIGSIDRRTLDDKIPLIRDAIDGEITTPVNGANDAGGAVLIAYYYDPGKKLYQSVFLAQTGDFESHNTSQAAIELTDWLRQYVLFWLD